MAKITLKGKEINTIGSLPNVGEKAMEFNLVNSDLDQIKLSDYKGSILVLNVFPSIDTKTCATSVRTFNEMANQLPNTKILCISSDLPFAQNRFCLSENLKNVITLSDYGTSQFGKDYGLEIIDGPLFNLHSRSVIVIDKEGIIRHVEQVGEILDEPNYEAALKVIKAIN